MEGHTAINDIFSSIDYYLDLFYSALPLLVASAALVLLAMKIKAFILTENSYDSASVEKVLLYIAFAEILSGVTYAVCFDSNWLIIIFFLAYLVGLVIEFIRISQKEDFSLVSILNLYAISAIFINSLLSFILYIVIFAAIFFLTIFFESKLADSWNFEEISLSDKVILVIVIFPILTSGLMVVLHTFFGLETFVAIIAIVAIYSVANICEALAWLIQR
jgi:hypothetical protein